MANQGLIAAQEFCTHHRVAYTFIGSLHDAGLIAIDIIDEKPFIPQDEMPMLERMVRLHQELEINLAGIEAIAHLLQRVEAMQQELRRAKGMLAFYED